MSASHARSSAVLLAAFALFGSALLAVTHELTRARIAANERAATLRAIEEVLPPGGYDNDLLADARTVEAEALNPRAPATVYRARRDGAPVAVVMEVVAPDGYNGDIRLLVGIDAAGRITGVRVVSHRETPGLGDAIELRRSDWIHSFDGRSIGDPPLEAWHVRRDGGVFDQFTGATITPRAVVKAVRRALLYFREHRAELLEPATAS